MTLARVRALVVIGVLVLVAVSTVVWAIVRDGQTSPAQRACDAPESNAATAVPPPAAVKVRILNATDQNGLGATVAMQLRQAGFKVVTIGNESGIVESSAKVRYGPAGLGAAQLLRAYVRNSETVQDDKRKDGVVDLVLGDEFNATGITPSDQIKTELERLGPLELESATPC